MFRKLYTGASAFLIISGTSYTCEPVVGPKQNSSETNKLYFRTGSQLKKISVENINGSTRISASDEKQIIVTVTKTGPAKMLPKIKIETREVNNEIVVRTLACDYAARSTVDYEIIIPKCLVLSKMLACGTGKISVQASDGDIDVRNTNGDIEVLNLKGNVTAKGQKANLIARNIHGTVDARHVMGQKTVEHVTALAEARSA